MAASFADYRAALRSPGAIAPLLTSAIGRFPIAMLGLALLFYVQHGYQSFAAAGFVAAAALTGEGTASVLQGRIIDRLGPSRPLLVATMIFGCAGAGLVLAVENRLPVPVLVAAALALGLSAPALPGASRALWTQLIPASERRDQALEAAYTYEAVSLEVFFIIGPAAAAWMFAVVPWAGAGLVTAVAGILVGAFCFALTPTVRARRPSGAPRGSGLGALASPGMRVIAIASLGFGCVVGVVEVGVPAVTTHAGQPALAGWLLSGWSIASVLAGLLYGLRPWPRELRHRLPALLAGFGISVMLMAAAPGLDNAGPHGLIVMSAAMLLAGCLITPQVTGHSLGVELVAPPGTATEAFGWVITAAVLGLAVGQALGGALVEAAGANVAFLAGGGAGVALAVLLWLLRRHLAPAPMPPVRPAEVTESAC
ncbi:MFS transporter [Pseudonocardia eucalypti]|uniref:MFS transporter n=1 Tax=Pseudonocardia eucalypti TaxID=648755 RepID=A0ABP9PG27_9PSEU|nr:MFS family permease [Pseudonocardia eucalypti]